MMVEAALELHSGLWTSVLTHLWQTTIVLIVLAVLSCAMRRAPARMLNALWWIGLAKLIIPLQLVAPVLRRVIDPVSARAGAAGSWLDGVTVWLVRADSILDPAEAGMGARLAGLADGQLLSVTLLTLWCLGAAWLLFLLAKTRGPVVKCVAPGGLSSGMRARVNAALAGTGIPRRAVRVAAAPVMPATVGVLRPRIVVPRVLVERLEAAELRAILLHEDAHRRRFEPLQVAVQRAAATAFYFFPPVWPLLARLRETSEMACDEAAVRRGVSRSDFARALARTVSIGLEPPGLATAFARGAPSLTRRRLERLRDEGRFVSMKKHWLCLALAAIAVIMVSAFAVVSFATDSESTGECGEKATADEVVVEEKTYTITLVHDADPEYPEDARKDGAGGKVVLKMTVDPEKGDVLNIMVLEEVDGYPSLTKAAVDAAAEWTFSVEGDPEGDVEVIVPISFKMDGPHTKELSIRIPDATDKPAEPEDPAEPEEPTGGAEPAEPEAPAEEM
jgi:TonB family protein